ncbi:MAG: tripartite tricarboxylate transporter substrate binding protein [Burkholderiales bacterium]
MCALRRKAIPNGRSRLVLGALAAGLLGASSLAYAQGLSAGTSQAYPAKPVRLVVPTSPGGGTDFSARAIGPKLAEILGQPVVIENRAGGGTIIGNELVARAAPNGYTLLMGISSLTTIPYLYAKIPYDVTKDLAPVSQVVTVPHLLVAHPSLPVRSVKELIAFARARPGQLNFGAGSAGSNPHLAMELFNHLNGLKMVHVPFKGQGPAMTDVLGGHTSLMMANLLSALPHAKTGRLRAFGVSSAKRASVAPSIPAIAESGMPGFEVVQWFGVLAPANTPPEIILKVHSAVVRALQDPMVRDRFVHDGAEPIGGTPEEFAAVIRSDLAKWGKVIKEAGIKLAGGA